MGRGGINWNDGNLYRVMGTKFCSVAADGAVTVLGDVGGTGQVSLDYGFDRIAIVSLNGDAMESTDDRSRLLSRIDAYTVRASAFQRQDLLGEHVLETVAGLSRQLAEDPAGRKIIVGLGPAWLFDTVTTEWRCAQALWNRDSPPSVRSMLRSDVTATPVELAA